MTREDIIRMTNEANLPSCHLTHSKALERFAKLVAEHEREACIKIVESEAMQYAEPVWAFEILNDIKARGQA